MNLFLNELSIHEQFPDTGTFHECLGRLMSMRNSALRSGREVSCHHAILATSPIRDVPMQQAIGHLPNRDQQRAVIRWFTQGGKLWDQERQHEADDWFECCNEIVTESALGEAAYRQFQDIECGLLSAMPSDWMYSPVEVQWRVSQDELDIRCTNILNYWEICSLEESLDERRLPIVSWATLQEVSIERFSNLNFSDSCFDHLRGVPFVTSSASRVVALLGILDKLVVCFDQYGQRTPEGQRIYEQFFTGDRALFSDSSEQEKRKFSNKLTFPHPERAGTNLFCPWHGKERASTLRLHFSWPMRAGQPVYVVYVGPKITKR